MKIYITCEFSLGKPLSTYGAQKTGATLEKEIKSSKHDFLPDFIATIDQHYFINVGSMLANFNHYQIVKSKLNIISTC